MYAEERQHAIVTLAREYGRVVVTELAQQFDVSPETIRRDLDALSGLGILSRVHGGAVRTESLQLEEASIFSRETASTREKVAIARAAAALIPARPGVTVLLDAGTTTAKVAELLPPQVSAVVTNSVPTAGMLAQRHDATVLLLGGQVRGLTQATVGVGVLNELSHLHVDIAFIGTNGLSIEHGFTTPDSGEAAVKRAMVKSARQVVMCADASKFGVDYLVQFAAPEDVDVLVTDDSIPPRVVADFEARGVEVTVAR